jgi:hypothetical protein
LAGCGSSASGCHAIPGNDFERYVGLNRPYPEQKTVKGFMRHNGVYFILCTLLAAAVGNDVRATAQSVDTCFPRVFKKDGKQLTVYQPQVDYWQGFPNHQNGSRCTKINRHTTITHCYE